MRKKKRVFGFGVIALFLGLLGFSSCDNKNIMNGNEVPSTDKVNVTYEAYFQDAHGNLSLFTTDLRAVTGDKTKATITGDGSYYHNDIVNLKVVANDPYTLHELYEKSEKGGFTKAKGLVDAKEKTLTFNVTEDMTFVAVFTNVNAEERGYRNLKVDEKSADFTLSLSSTKDNYTQDLTKDMLAVGEEVAAVKTADGVITGFTVINATYKAWDMVGPTPASDWLTATFDKTSGKLSLVAKPYNAKVPARTTKVRVGKDGSNAEMPGSWVEVTVSQSAFYTGVDEVDSDSEFSYGDGTIANIKPTLNVDFNPKGDKKDFKTLDKNLNNPIYVLVPTYKDGQLLPKDEWVKKPVVVDFGQPTQSWLTKNDSSYAAPMNDGKAPRQDNIVVSFKVDDKIVASSVVTVKQDAVKYNVDVEIQ